MSVGLYKYNGNIFDDSKEILSENIASQRMYNKYLEPAIEKLNIYYFQDGAEIRKDNLDSVMSELELLIKWVMDNVEGDDLKYLLCRLQNIKKVIPKSLKMIMTYYIFFKNNCLNQTIKYFWYNY